MKKFLLCLSILTLFTGNIQRANAGLLITVFGAGLEGSDPSDPAGKMGTVLFIAVGPAVLVTGGIVTAVGFGTLNPIIGLIGVGIMVADGEDSLDQNSLFEVTKKLVPEIKNDPETLEDMSKVIGSTLLNAKSNVKEDKSLYVKVSKTKTREALAFSNLTSEQIETITTRLN